MLLRCVTIVAKQLYSWKVLYFLTGIFISISFHKLTHEESSNIGNIAEEVNIVDAPTDDHKQDAHYLEANDEEVRLFKEFDLDENGLIDIKEFVAIADILLGLQNEIAYDDPSESSIKEYDNSFDESFELHAEMIPFNVTNLVHPTSTAAFGSFKVSQLKSFPGLTSWKSVNIVKQEFYALQFKSFLPPPSKSDTVGVPYWLWTGGNNEHHDDLSSNRYNPREPSHPVERIMFNLLKMFHPRPFVWIRFQPQGGAAVIRAVNDVYYDIFFRFHCEFQLNEYPNLPFWFTPSQFAGHFIYAKDGSHIRDFVLEVPNERKLNVDLEWVVPPPSKTSEEVRNNDNDDVIPDMEVDIGYIPLLRLHQKSPSSPRVLVDENGNEFDQREIFGGGEDINIQFDDIVWNVEISEQEARDKLEEKFYPFKKVNYHGYREAVQISRQLNKPVHNVVLWGALDDQSC